MSMTKKLAFTYVSGIGLLCDQAGQIDLDDVPVHEPLLLVAPSDLSDICRVAAPLGGWTREALQRALATHESYIRDFAPVDALIGERWLGCTEV